MKKKLLLPRSARGQSLVELAVSLVILLYLLSGAVEFGILFFQYVQLRDAAQEGALYGSTSPPRNPATDPTGYANGVSAIQTRAKSASSSPIDLTNDPNVTVSVVVTDGKYCEGGSLQVTVSYPHRIFMPFMPQLIGRNQIVLSGQVTDTILTPISPC